MSNDLAPNVVYLGELTYYQEKEDRPTPFYVVMPNGVGYDNHCFVLGSFGADAAGVPNRAVTSIGPRMSMRTETKFDLRKTAKTGEYYWFQGEVKNGGEKLVIDMLNPDNDKVATVQLTKQTKSIRWEIDGSGEWQLQESGPGKY